MLMRSILGWWKSIWEFLDNPAENPTDGHGRKLNHVGGGNESIVKKTSAVITLP